ncbi:MAG: TIGR00282 family metallophosphoesterase [Magnetococcales bacterium]|nr:TIGR00282 family metallophosphoesterase [Magnetococcales bacterium]
MRILMVGDVVGKAGRRALKRHLPDLRRTLGLDAVVVNGENSAGGIGITAATAREIFEAGADLITTGNHVWRHAEVIPYLENESRLLRPANYPPGVPGRGWGVFVTPGGHRIVVLNLQGRVFMEAVDCPFRVADEWLGKRAYGQPAALLVDFHAEATSEKAALAHHLDGRVSAVLGTHTHVPTADHRILPRGTGFQTDIGMTGCYDSIIGMEKASVLPRFLQQLPSRFEPAEREAALCGALLEIDPATTKCRLIRPVRRGPDLEEA